jgi:hypothetical protein
MIGRAQAAPSRLGPVETALLPQLVLASECPLEALEATVRSGAPIDWEQLLTAAERHRLSPLVLGGVRRTNAALRAPLPVLEALQNARNLELARTVVRLSHLEELGEIALSKRLELCVLKGAAFSVALYGDPATRPMGDIDVLVRRSDLARWTAEVESLGYDLVSRSDHATCFRRRGSGVLLELHHELTSSASFLGLAVDEVLDRSIPLSLADGTRLRTLCWEDHLLHLSLHASFQHGFRQPAVNAWDARCIAERHDFDLNAFVERGGNINLAPWVYGGLRMSEALFPGGRLTRARLSLEERVPPRVVRKGRGFRPEALLAPAPDTVFGTPFARLTWTGIHPQNFSLLLETSRPRSLEERPGALPRFRRIVHLVRNHGFTALRSKWKALPTPLATPPNRFTWRGP